MNLFLIDDTALAPAADRSNTHVAGLVDALPDSDLMLLTRESLDKLPAAIHAYTFSSAGLDLPRARDEFRACLAAAEHRSDPKKPNFIFCTDQAWARMKALAGPIVENRHHVRITAPLARTKTAPAGLQSAFSSDFVARTLEEVLSFTQAKFSAISLSIVLLAYNEAESLGAAIGEIRAFCRLFVERYEIIIVDDGSVDHTGKIARAAAADQSGALARQMTGQIQLVVHDTNKGMGASMRDGYRAATMDYIVSLPADRQVRAQSLLPLLAVPRPGTCTLSSYETPHSEPYRHLISALFRGIRRHVGGLRVDYDGAYIIPRTALETLDPNTARSDTFLFSYELLEELRGAGYKMARAPAITPFLRESGESRVARPGRIVKVVGEILKSRLRRL